MRKSRSLSIIAVFLLVASFFSFASCSMITVRKIEPTTEKSEVTTTANSQESKTFITKINANSITEAKTSATEKNNTKSFDNTAFFGNSFIETLRDYGIPKDADFIYRVGLTVTDAMKLPMARHTKPIIDELNDKSYDNIFTFFGENELGWSYPDIFIKDYKKVIDSIKQRQPNTNIVVVAILPVTKEVSKKNIEQTNNNRIVKYNKMLKKMADECNVEFINPAKILTDKSGALPKSAASDGIHINKEYSIKMLEYFKEKM